MTGTSCDLFTHKSSRSYLNHLVHTSIQGSVKLYHSTSHKIKMAGPPLKTRRYTPLQETKLHKARGYKEERKTFNSMVT
jgi:hypothetical protein